MQRLYTMFPRGLPGLALFVLRSGVALTLLLRLQEQWPNVTALFMTGYCFSSLALLLGLMTPIVAMLAILIVLFTPNHKLTNENIFDFIVESVAVSMLGPGVYSIDGIRYARRPIKFPSNDDDS